MGRALPPPGAQAARVERRGLADTDLSLPGLTFTRNRPYTGRWSDVLIPGQDEYLSGQMSPLWRLLYRTRSCGETAGARTPAPGLLCVQPRLALRLGPCRPFPKRHPRPCQASRPGAEAPLTALRPHWCPQSRGHGQRRQVPAGTRLQWPVHRQPQRPGLDAVTLHTGRQASGSSKTSARAERGWRHPGRPQGGTGGRGHRPLQPLRPAAPPAHRVRRRPLLGRGVIRILPNIKLVRREEVDVWLLEAPEDGPWSGRRPPQTGRRGAQAAPPAPEPAPPPEPSPPRPTFLHLPGELVELQQGRHTGARVLPQNGLHGHAPSAQAEVEVSEPEHPVKARGDVRCGTSRARVSPARPSSHASVTRASLRPLPHSRNGARTPPRSRSQPPGGWGLGVPGRGLQPFPS